MKPKLSEYALILFSLVTIFACGCGIGYFLAKSNPIKAPVSQPGREEAPDWESRTLEKLTTSLSLTPSQRDQVNEEISAVSRDIAATKSQALHDYHQHLLKLHDRIQPHLDEAQRKRMDKDRKSLEKLIERK